IAAVIGFYLTRYFIIRAIHILVVRSKSKWDDVLADNKVFIRLAYLAPAVIINFMAEFILTDMAVLVRIVELITGIYIIIVLINVLFSIINSVYEIYQTFDVAKEKPIKGYLQVLKIIIYIVAGVAVISIIIGEKSVGWIAGFGAFSAILMLVFKDPILGFVGGIQLSANNMVRIGDWIEMPKYGADGTVIDISLTTVKVQNWDKTITTIPTYTLVTDYFKNWRGMEESGGRRIKRSINIDMNSVKFCTLEMLERFRKFEYVTDYIDKTEKVLSDYNAKRNIDNSVMVNGRRQTNLGVFRAYLKSYLEDNPKLNKEMTFMVRQLQPTSEGIPMEIYVFSKDQEWEKYETIQADIFDHVLAVIPAFDLRVFQNPSGHDFSNFAKIHNQ
ncbi:MAG TPA: mechanosensitive ion channel domain-containing protein, partial [Bacteroidales bacterium]|nr:mechanosensitive ion channel domain-containing protein [Bacteroidales bacterium]